MTRRTLLIGGAAAVAVLGGAAYLLVDRGSHTDTAADASPTATVTVTQVRRGPLRDITDVYGVVAPDPASAVAVAAPRPVIVVRVLTRSGETVRSGQGLIQVRSSPGADQAYRQAVAAANQSQADLARVQRLYDQRLAANDQLQAAKKAAADAQAVLAALRKQGAGQQVQTLSAPAAGVVTAVAVAAGDHVAQDAPLVTLAASDRMVAKLGLEAGATVRVGDPVAITPVAGASETALNTRISMVSLAADPTTRTFDALAPVAGRTWPLGAAVEARITTGIHDGLSVPRDAVVYDETGTHVFTVSAGHAHRVFVTAGRTHGQMIEVTGSIHSGQAVAVQGADELEDGMAVKVAGR